MLYGTSDAEPQTDYVVAQLSQELYNSNLLLLLIQVINYECLLFSFDFKLLIERRCGHQYLILFHFFLSCIVLLFFFQNLNRIDFEGKKDVAQVFNNVLRRQIGTRSPTVEYICTKPEILFTLIAGYDLFTIGNG